MNMPTTLKGWMQWHWKQLWTWRSLFDLAIVIAVSWIGAVYNVSLWIQYPVIFGVWFMVSLGLLIIEQARK